MILVIGTLGLYGYGYGAGHGVGCALDVGYDCYDGYGTEYGGCSLTGSGLTACWIL